MKPTFLEVVSPALYNEEEAHYTFWHSPEYSQVESSNQNKNTCAFCLKIC